MGFAYLTTLKLAIAAIPSMLKSAVSNGLGTDGAKVLVIEK